MQDRVPPPPGRTPRARRLAEELATLDGDREATLFAPPGPPLGRFDALYAPTDERAWTSHACPFHVDVDGEQIPEDEEND